MANAEALISKIVQESEESAQKLRNQADEEAVKILAKAKLDAEEIAKTITLKAKEKAEGNKRRAFTMAELESRKEILFEKQKQIEASFNGAVQRIAAMDKTEYENMMMDMLLDSVESADETVIISSGDENRLDDQFISKVNDELQKKGKKGELKLEVDPNDFGGGFILRSAQYRINNSLLSIIRMQRDELEPEVAEILFQ
jgi:V/A-type H+/Na+-transporting ATPase subunit E